jgi:hypothetical protein
MQTLDEILETLRKLPPDERAQVRAELDTLEQTEAIQESSPDNGTALREWLALAGTFHSDYSDVASDKYKHLADVYSDER